MTDQLGQALNSDKFRSRYARIGSTDGFIKKAYTFLRAMVKDAQDEITKAEHEAYETYKNTVGEIEACNAAERINLSAEKQKN